MVKVTLTVDLGETEIEITTQSTYEQDLPVRFGRRDRNDLALDLVNEVVGSVKAAIVNSDNLKEPFSQYTDDQLLTLTTAALQHPNPDPAVLQAVEELKRRGVWPGGDSG